MTSGSFASQGRTPDRRSVSRSTRRHARLESAVPGMQHPTSPPGVVPPAPSSAEGVPPPPSPDGFSPPPSPGGFSPPPSAPPATTPRPALHRSRDNRVIAGVCGGIGATLGIDPVLVRLALVLLTLAGGAGVLAYLVGWLVIPLEGGDAPVVATQGASGVVSVTIGSVLVLAGGWLLAARYVPDLTRVLGQVLWPVTLILAGVALLAGRRS